MSQSEIVLNDEDRYVPLRGVERCPVCYCLPFLERKAGRYRVLCNHDYHHKYARPAPQTEWTRLSHEAVRAWQLYVKLSTL